MIRSFIFSDGKLVSEAVEYDALKLVRADEGLHVWIDLQDPTDEECRMVFQDLYAFHPLAIEDAMAGQQFPKIDDYGDFVFMTLHGVDYAHEDRFATSDLDIFLGEDYVVTHHSGTIPAMETAIQRLRDNRVIRAKTIDRVVYRLIDGLVDNYQPLLNEIHLEIEALEDEVFSQRVRSPEVMQEFRALRHDVMRLGQIVRPQQEVIARIAHGEFKFIRPYLTPYFRDINDNLRRLESAASEYTEQLFLMIDLYLNKSANETNDIIKLLTVLTAVTTPTMIVGTWFGMNFKDMPELDASDGYNWAFWLTLLSTVLLLVWLRFKKWL